VGVGRQGNLEKGCEAFLKRRNEKGEPLNEARAEDKLVCTMPCKEEEKTAKRD
jgi:hypothetical protein